MGFARKNLGVDITGGGARRAAERASRNSAAAGEEARAGILEAGAPFGALGLESAGLLSNLLSQPGAQGVDPQTIINNPFFQALSQEQDQNTLAGRAALGLAGSGGTQDALKRQQLLLGNQFQQQEVSNQQNRFNNLFNVTQLGANAAIGTAGAAGNLTTDIANAQNVGIQAKAQQQSALGGQLMSLAGGLGGAAIGAGGFGSLFGGSALGGGAGGALNSSVSGVGGGFFGSGAIPSSLTSANILGGP
jgi:hypothetical protein